VHKAASGKILHRLRHDKATGRGPDWHSPMRCCHRKLKETPRTAWSVTGDGGAVKGENGEIAE